MLATVTAAEFDYYAAEKAKHLMWEAAHEARIRHLSDAELANFIRDCNEHDGWDYDANRWDVNAIGWNEYELHIAWSEVEAREDAAELAAAKARYSFDGPLTHTPFAGLVA